MREGESGRPDSMSKKPGTRLKVSTTQSKELLACGNAVASACARGGRGLWTHGRAGLWDVRQALRERKACLLGSVPKRAHCSC